MYSKCIVCEKLGITCKNLNFLAMSSQDLMEFLKARKKFLGYSNTKLAELSKVPVGTVSRIFSAELIDCKFETLRPIIKVLTGYVWEDDNCPSPQSDEVTAQTLADLEIENCKLKAIIESEEQRRLADVEAARAENKKLVELLEKRVDYLQGLLRYNKMITFILGAVLAVAICLIIGALLVDKLNPDLGFLWVR